MARNRLANKLKELESELASSEQEDRVLTELKQEIVNLGDILVDANSDLIATFVEGTKRLIKKPNDSLKGLEAITTSTSKELKRAVSDVERAVKGLKLPTATELRTPAAVLKLPIKELTRSVREFEFPSKASDAIPVRLSDGKAFYKALDSIIQTIGGGGATSYAFDKQDSSPTKAATVAVTISGKSRDVVAVVNPDGSNVGGSVSIAEDDIPATGLSEALAVQVVDASGNQITSFGGTQYNEDTAHQSGDGGVQMLAVRDNTTPATLTNADGDYEPLHLDGNGNLWVSLGTQLNSTQDSVTAVPNYTEGDTDTTISGFALMGEGTSDTLRAISAPTSGDGITSARGIISFGQETGSGGYYPVGVSVNGGVKIGDGTDEIDVLAAGADNVVNTTNELVTASFLYGYDGTTWDRIRGDSTNGIDVDVTNIVPGTAATALGKAEDAGHTTGDTGVFVLGVRNDTPNTTLTGSDAEYIQLSTYKTGAVRTAVPEEDFAALGSNHVKKYYTSAGAATDGIVWSPAAGKRWYVTDIFINTSAAATITLEDDLSGGDSVVWKAELAANSGWSHPFTTPLFSGEDAADLIITTSTGNVYVMVTGYEI